MIFSKVCITFSPVLQGGVWVEGGEVPMCWSWFYKAANPPLRKADHLSLAIGDMVCG